MKKYLLGAVMALVSLSAHAQDTRMDPTTVSGDFGVVTDYRNRGISRSDEGPALQGRIQLNHPLGLYGGLSGSTVDLNSDNDANVEAVLFGGYKGQFDSIDYNGKLSYTSYPGGDNDDEDYWEFTMDGGYDFGPFYASMTWGFSPDYINSSGMSFYYGGDIAVPLPYDITAKGHLGFQFVDDENRYIASDSTDWSLGAYYNWADYNVNFGVQYVDTDLDDNECVESCGSQFLLSAKKPFGW